MDKLGKTGVTPALTLMILAPLLTEILPGATRFSSLFVLPIEICVWGGGAVLIRDAVRRWQLGWLNMLLLAIALAVAEECLIQQTSLAPLVIRLKGVTYARALGVILNGAGSFAVTDTFRDNINPASVKSGGGE